MGRQTDQCVTRCRTRVGIAGGKNFPATLARASALDFDAGACSATTTLNLPRLTFTCCRPQAAQKLLVLAAFAAPLACQSAEDDAPSGSDTSNSSNTSSTNETLGSTSTTASTGSTMGTTGSTTGATMVGSMTGTTSSVTSTTDGSTNGSSNSTTGSDTTGTGGATTVSSTGMSTSDGGGGTGGSGNLGGVCPPGTTGTPTLGGTPARVQGVPPADSFNMNNSGWGNIEGPVWIDGALYVSEMSNASYTSMSPDQKMSRMLKIENGTVSIFVADSGSNGLAVNAAGNIVAGVHKDGSISQFLLTGGAPSVVVGAYMGAPFNSPNDLAIRSDGTIYFSDPSYNAPTPPPQPNNYVYRLPPGGQVEPIPDAASPEAMVNPNGVTLSLAEDYLYVAAETGRRFPVMADGSLGAGQDFAPASGGDGMVIDCAGNLYVAKGDTPNVEVFTPDGASLGNITVSDLQGDYTGVTNVAFGGSDRKTLYITGHGNNKGLFELELDIPGLPY